jgi:hypothetical protein
MTLSDRIRKAALGPTPRLPDTRCNWLKRYDVWLATERLYIADGSFLEATNIERRMFLLFCAEALKAQP